MKINCTKGTVDQMLAEFKNRIDELSGGIDSSFDYPDDLIDLENGEYESHMTEPINASEYDDQETTAQEVLDFLANKGYDASRSKVQHYAEAVAEYMNMCRDAWHDTGERFNYTLDQWYKDTLQNYGYDLEALPRIDSSFDYPDDLIALENGEYESHMTEPINSSYEVNEVNLSDPYDHYLERLVDRVCERMEDEFGYYTECDVLNEDEIWFSVYDGPSSNDIMFKYFIDPSELYRKEDKMMADTSEICNLLWDQLQMISKGNSYKDGYVGLY